MPDVRAVQETVQFQAGSPASITVTAVDAAGDPVDVTGLTFVVALRPTGTIIATTLDPEAGTRVFSLTGADTTAIAAGGGLYSIADGDAEWIVGTARASTEGTRAQDHTLSVRVGAAQINVEVSAAIGGGPSGPSGSLPIAARVATPVSNLGGSVGSGVATIPPFSALPAGQLVWLTSQTSGADDGFYVHGSGGVFTVTTDYIDAAYLGWIIAVGTDLDTGTATAYVVRNDGSGIVVERVSLTPAQLATALAAKVDAADLGTSAFLDVGDSAGEVAAGDDARFTDDRDPNPHAASHGNSGADEVTIDASQIATGTVAAARLPAPALPRFVSIAPWAGWSAASSTAGLARTADSASFGGGWIEMPSTGGVASVGRHIDWDVLLDAGTWAIDAFSTTGTAYGIMAIDLDGVEVVPSWDQYSGSTVRNVVQTFTGITVATGGVHTIAVRIKAAGTGGAYSGRVQHLCLRRTGA